MNTINICMARIYINSPCSNPNFQLKKLLVAIMGLIIVVAFVALIITAVIEPYMYSENTYDNIGDLTTEKHYGLVIDCGSSGSRVYVYSWPTHSGNPGDLLKIEQLTDRDGKLVMKKVSPGLSSYENKPSEASDHISRLLEYASQYIPKEQHKETPLYILATAGMRMISEKAQKEILNDLQKDIPNLFEFLVAENHFEVISGKLEGVYAWIAVNYVLDKFSHGPEDHELVSVRLPGDSPSTPLHTRRRTTGMMDMGGGSVQIAFEVLNPKKTLPKSLTAEINLGCQNSDIDHTYNIYVTTFLEYGANSAMERHVEKLIKQYTSYEDWQMGRNKSKAIPEPCYPVKMPISKNVHGKKYFFKGTGEWNECRKSLQSLLNTSVACNINPCSMNGVHQPDIDHERSKFFGFSEFWYSTEDVFSIGGHYDFSQFQSVSEEFCKTKWSTLKKRYEKKLYPKADDDRFRNQCFKGAWLSTVVHDGFKFPTDYKHLISAQLINKKDVQWTLGALLYRTRYLPLRDIQNMSHSPSYKSPVSSIFANEYLIILCIAIVMCSIFLYMKRLKLCPKNDIHRVPSMSYFMTDENEPELGVKTSRNSYYL